MIHRANANGSMSNPVVNCFQISTLVDDSQDHCDVTRGFFVVNCFQISTLVDDSQAR